MNEFNDYLARLGQDLKQLSRSEQDEILAEIESHIEEGGVPSKLRTISPRNLLARGRLALA